jgi:DNA-binding XRE family transcriptional regulator
MAALTGASTCDVVARWSTKDVSRLTDHVSAVAPLGGALDGGTKRQPQRVRVEREGDRIRCPLCSTEFTDVKKWGVHALREMRQVIARETDAEVERLMQRHTRRFPGEGCVSPYYTKGRVLRYRISVTETAADGRKQRITRRRGPNGEHWTTRQAAEDALVVMLRDGVWPEFRPWSLPPASKRQALREERGLSVSDLARAVGVSRKSILNWEAGSEPTGEHARKYALALTD